MYLTPIKNPSDNDQRILFPRATNAALEKHGVTADIALEINKTFYMSKVPTNIRIERLAYNKKGNLSELMKMTATSSMFLPQHNELLLQVEEKYDPEINNVKGDQM